MNVDEEDEDYQRIQSLEAENESLIQEVKDLKNALTKHKIFHRKFANDVTEAEEVRMQDYDNEIKGLRVENKRVTVENRLLTKDKAFYQAAYNALTKDDGMNLNSAKMLSKNLSKSTLTPTRHPYNTRRSSSEFDSSSTSSCHLPINEVSIHSSSGAQNKANSKSLKEATKMSEKWFEASKKMKLKITKILKENASLKLKVKQLEGFKEKMQNKKTKQEACRHELQSLFESTRCTNEQIFNAGVLSKLGQLSSE